MKLIIAFFTAICAMSFITPAPASAKNPESKWKLDWVENFNGTKLDTTVWSKISRGKPDWKNTQSSDPRCYEFRNGCLVLKGIVNDDLKTDTARYLTGGVYTKGKLAFKPGKFEIRARLHGAKGAWPAIWLLPFSEEEWPYGGEIDIMERLNNNHIVYQTVHSNYTVNLHQTKNPKSGGTYPINREEFNVYGVEITPDSLIFTVNGKNTLIYPRIPEKGKEGQYPFYQPQYLLLDMQLGGKWVGAVDKDDLPVEMEIDWVKYYVPKE